MLRRLRNAAWLLLTGVVLGAVGAWQLGPSIGRQLERGFEGWDRVPADGSWDLAPGLDAQVHTQGLDHPTRIAFVPDGEPGAQHPLYYVAELPGRIRAVTHDGTVATVADELLESAWPEGSEIGLTGLAVDPDGTRLYAGFVDRDRETGLLGNRVEAIELSADGLTADTRTVLLRMRDEAALAGYGLQFVEIGPDGLLYVGVGKGTTAADAQNLDRFAGKILRMRRDGRAVADNPFYVVSSPRAVRSYVYALGLQNPVDLVFRGRNGQAFVADAGAEHARVVPLAAGRNYCFGTGPDDDAMRCNSLYTWGPRERSTLAGLALIGPRDLRDEPAASLWVASIGSPSQADPEPGSRVNRLRLDEAGALRGIPDEMAEYRGLAPSQLSHLQWAKGALWATDRFGAGEGRGSGQIWQLSDRAAEAAPAEVAGGRDRSPYASGARLFTERGCVACHARDAAEGDRAGPLLGSGLAQRLDERLNASDYDAGLGALEQRSDTYFVERRPIYRALAGLSGPARVRAWLVELIRDPRFDNPEARMPGSPTLSEEELEALATYLLGPDRS